MSWALLILGVGLWAGAHLFKRALPDRRAAMGDAGKGVVAVALLAAIVLMTVGYRGTPEITVWVPPPFLTHVNNLLVLVAFYFLSPAPSKGRLFYRMRHPMLTGFAIWAVSHLLVNGNLAAIVLFGGLLAWSPVAMAAINRAEPDWQRNPPGEWKWDAIGVAGAVVLLLVVGLIHGWLGPWPFGA